jgi:protein involved in polysaccharide export with SLBB domain
MDIEEAYQVMQEHCGLKVGDKVRILRKAKDFEMGWATNWPSSMDIYIGETGKVDDTYCNSILVLTKDGIKWHFPFFVLEKIEDEQKVRVDGNLNYPIYSKEGDSTYI